LRQRERAADGDCAGFQSRREPALALRGGVVNEGIGMSVGRFFPLFPLGNFCRV
jgi:hypothetical protein